MSADPPQCRPTLRRIPRRHPNVGGSTATSLYVAVNPETSPQCRQIHRNVALRCGESRDFTAMSAVPPQRRPTLRRIPRLHFNVGRHAATSPASPQLPGTLRRNRATSEPFACAWKSGAGDPDASELSLRLTSISDRVVRGTEEQRRGAAPQGMSAIRMCRSRPRNRYRRC